jgi:hypothetical protein
MEKRQDQCLSGFRRIGGWGELEKTIKKSMWEFLHDGLVLHPVVGGVHMNLYLW